MSSGFVEGQVYLGDKNIRRDAYFIVIESLRDGGHMYTATKHVISICIPQTKKDAVAVKMIVHGSHCYNLLSASILTVN